MGAQVINASFDMPPQDSSTIESETQDITDPFSTLEDGEDPILKMIQYDEEKSGNLKLQTYKHLWPMIKFLYDRLNTVANENKVLKENNKALKEEIVAAEKKRADLQDEFIVFKQSMIVRAQSNSANQSNQSQSYAHVTGSGSLSVSNITSGLSFQAGRSSSIVQQSTQRQIYRPQETNLQTSKNVTSSQQQSPLPNAQSPLPPMLPLPANPSPYLTLSKGQSSQNIEVPFTEVSYARKRLPSQPVIRGNLQVNEADEDESDSGLFSLLKLDHQPFKDFLIRGIKNVQDTPFKDTDGKPDVKQYGDAIRKQIGLKGIKVRFVKVFVHREGDMRGTTSARVGCYAADQKAIMSPSLWPPNVTVRTWQFNAGNVISNQSKNLQ